MNSLIHKCHLKMKMLKLHKHVYTGIKVLFTHGIFKHKKREAPFNNITKSLCRGWIMKFLMTL